MNNWNFTSTFRGFALLLFGPLLFWGPLHLSAQIYDPVDWSFSHEAISENEVALRITATIEEGWAVYSQFLESEDGPIATSFEFDEGNHFQRLGKVIEEGKPKEGFDEMFQMNLIKFFQKVTFVQKVKVSDFSKPITGYFTYMTCDDERCLPPTDVDFSFDLSALKKEIKTAPASATPKEGATGQAAPADKQEQETAQPGASWTAKLPAPPADVLAPVKWEVTATEMGKGEYQLVFQARIDQGWNIYSKDLSGEEGPLPTTLTWFEGPHFSLAGELVEKSSKVVREYDEVFAMELVKLKKDARYTQRVRVVDPAQKIKGEIEYMVCEGGRCLPPAFIPFAFQPSQNLLTLGEDLEAEAEAGTANAGDDPLIPEGAGDIERVFESYLTATETPVADCEAIESQESSSSLWNIFALGFVGGLIALLTPCVFPMIPLTVSFFTKSSGNRKKGVANALLYGFFILLVYVLLSLPFHLLDTVNPNILNDISTNVGLNIFFFLIFLFFAFSFFGYYELTLPSSWTNKASSAEGVGGVVGIFFMALTLALVSFSCTGPILGSLLAGSMTANGGAMQLTMGMSGFGLALALPFALFAGFPTVMNALPRSGGWLNTVKVVLGFVELALAFKFLSNADLVKHWGLLKVEVFLGIWILVALGLAAYLFGLIKFPHDSPKVKLSIGRIALGLLSLAFAGYLATGLTYDKEAGSLRSLTLLSGLAPPACYSWWYPCDCPQNLNCFKDFEEGMAFAKEKELPVMVDFTGHACVNCRKMEEQVWPKKEVYKYLKDEYVLISLYVDEKIELPEEEQMVKKYPNGGSIRIRNTGHKWQYLQNRYFKNNSQPWYVLLSPDGALLNEPVGYTPDETEYAKFLKCGLTNYEAHQQKTDLLGEKR